MHSCSWRVTQYGPGGAGEQDEHESAVCSCREEGQAHAGLHWQACSQSSREVILPLWCFWDHISHTLSESGLSTLRETVTCWSECGRMLRGLQLVTCLWSVWIGASSGEGKISLQSYLSSGRLCVKKMEPGSSLRCMGKGWEAMAVSSCWLQSTKYKVL